MSWWFSGVSRDGEGRLVLEVAVTTIYHTVSDLAYQALEAYVADPERRDIDHWAREVSAKSTVRLWGPGARPGATMADYHWWVRDMATDYGNSGRAPVFPEREP